MGRILLSLALALLLGGVALAGEVAEVGEKPMDVGGLWLTNLGLMELKQDGLSVVGRYALRGTSSIEGTIDGSKLVFDYKAFGQGSGTFEFAGDGKTFEGSAARKGAEKSFDWKGRRAPEFVRHVKLQPGKIVDGSTEGLLTYAVRAPEGYKPDDGRKWPTIVILHGSNMNARAYVNTIASSWPGIAKRYLIVGINGELPSNIGSGRDEPRFNYTYVNFVGRSTFKGFAGTDRESPALVSEAMKELREVYPVEKYFVGGHSQGGFLTYSLLMNYPELLAGAFPVSAGVIVQCEPGAYADEKLMAEQRAVPLAIVHGKSDKVVGVGMSEYAAKKFGDAQWSRLRFFEDNSAAGHRFAMLPIDQAIEWLGENQDR